MENFFNKKDQKSEIQRENISLQEAPKKLDQIEKTLIALDNRVKDILKQNILKPLKH